MAVIAPPADQAADLLQKLPLGTQTKTIEIPEHTKKSSKDSVTSIRSQLNERSVTPTMPDIMDPTMSYIPNGYPSTAYFYGGYNGSGTEWEDYTRYMNLDGVEMTPGVYGDNGSLVYHHGYGYAPYGPYSPATSPVPTLGHNGQLYGAQQYHYPTPYFQSMTPTISHPTTAATVKGEISTSAAADQVPLSVDSANAKSNDIANSGSVKGNNGSATSRAAYQNSLFNASDSYARGALSGGIPASGYQDPRFGFDGFQSPVPWLDCPFFPDGQPRAVTTSSISNVNGNSFSRNQNHRPHLMGLPHPRPISRMNTANGYANRMYPNKVYGQYDSAYKSGLAYGSYGYDSRTYYCGWMAADGKKKPRGRGNEFYNYSNESMDGLNELNRGPRGKSSKNQKGFTPLALVVRGQNIPLNGAADCEKEINATPDHEQYNRTDFPDNYADAKFYIIKSYSEDDVHKSIKYNIWASTPNGNKKLDLAYQDAQQKSGGCPVFLFFSVNTSGQFIGVAEMTGPVDFDKSVEYWQQDKWIGCFPVKWHIVKDVPNNLLKHIILVNNENKPVTNSRDTQEVKLEQGLQMLKLFKDHASKQSVLDDFDFYEDRQKRIQDKKAKQHQFLKQAQQWEGKLSEEKSKENGEGKNGDHKSQKSLEVASDLMKEATPKVVSNGDRSPSKNGYLSKSGQLLESLKPVTVSEEKIVANGVANGC
ncbi:unnamed protein product [Fraxinus pennsylvanica]|uniref:YTH domain-containing family protein n=1 Tax=Fraxinus pennsylvanica TaxID=56036 RepID=A0AAD2DYK6_9LAMI|nr:unnamed protein product [Fraxinus pennsylvanica]